jgi:hypothetical protein
MTLTAAEIAEIQAMAAKASPKPFTVTVDRVRYTITLPMIIKIRSDRERAGSYRRAYNSPGNARVLGELRDWVANELEVDKLTAHHILKRIKADRLYK